MDGKDGILLSDNGINLSDSHWHLIPLPTIPLLFFFTAIDVWSAHIVRLFTATERDSNTLFLTMDDKKNHLIPKQVETIGLQTTWLPTDQCPMVCQSRVRFGWMLIVNVIRFKRFGWHLWMKRTSKSEVFVIQRPLKIRWFNLLFLVTRIPIQSK